MVLRASDQELAAEGSWKYVLRRQVSFFAEENGFKGLLQWIGEKNPFFEDLSHSQGALTWRTRGNHSTAGTLWMLISEILFAKCHAWTPQRELRWPRHWSIHGLRRETAQYEDVRCYVGATELLRSC